LASALRGNRRLFIYWRLALADAAAAAEVVRMLHRELRAQHPGLQAEVYVREDLAIADATLMETYALEAGAPNGGVTPELQALIERAAEERTRTWRRGQRHVEVFRVCAD
jgi:Domain of unknown function (DUF4936)